MLALHYFQGMTCYRSATLLGVIGSRYFGNMFVFSRVIYRRSCISDVYSNNSCFSMNKKVEGNSSPRTHAVKERVLVLSTPLYHLSYHSAKERGLF